MDREGYEKKGVAADSKLLLLYFSGLAKENNRSLSLNTQTIGLKSNYIHINYKSGVLTTKCVPNGNQLKLQLFAKYWFLPFS